MLETERGGKSHVTYLPNSKDFHKDIIRETGKKHLADDVNMGGERRLEHDGHVRGVEKLDGVRATLSTEAVALDRNLDAETLEVNDDGKYGKRSDEIHHVRETFAPESFAQGTTFVIPCEEKVEQGDDGTLEFRAATGVDGGRGKGLPNDRLTDVGGDEERDTGTKTITFLKELIEENHNERSGDELDDKQKANSSTEVRRLAIEASEHVNGGLTKGD